MGTRHLPRNKLTMGRRRRHSQGRAANGNVMFVLSAPIFTINVAHYFIHLVFILRLISTFMILYVSREHYVYLSRSNPTRCRDKAVIGEWRLEEYLQIRTIAHEL